MNQVRPIGPRLIHFEDALHKTGWGLYYKFLVGFAAVTLFTNGFVLLCIHLAIPLSACDTLLQESDVITIFLCFAAGKTIGGFLLCSISDNSGKRCMITKTFMFLFCSCFISAFSHNAYTLYFAAVLLGSGLEANSVAMKIHLCEILPTHRRGLYVILPDLFWTIGYFTTSVFLYYLGSTSTNLKEHHGMDMRLTTWRIVFAVGGGFCITLACSSALLELSPRYLLFKRRHISAGLALKQFYAINKSKYSETFDVHSQQLVDLVPDYNINRDPEPVGLVSQTTVTVKVIARMVKVIFRKPFLKVILVVGAVKLPVLFGIVGCNTFLTHHLVPKANIQTTDFMHLPLIYINNCTVSFDDTEYKNFLLLSTNVLFGQILLLCVIDRFGRRFPIRLTLCSATNVFLAFNTNFTAAAIGSSFFTVGYAVVESALQVVVIESFPTALRGTAMGLVNSFSHLVSYLVFFFHEKPRKHFHCTMAFVAAVATLVSCFIPEMRGRPMIE